MKTAVQKDTKFVLQSPSQVRDEAKFDITRPRAWILPYQTIASLFTACRGHVAAEQTTAIPTFAFLSVGTIVDALV